jgi:hypothetical protein
LYPQTSLCRLFDLVKECGLETTLAEGSFSKTRSAGASLSDHPALPVLRIRFPVTAEKIPCSF